MSWRTAKGPHHWKLRHWGAKPSSRRKSRKKKKKKKRRIIKKESHPSVLGSTGSSHIHLPCDSHIPAWDRDISRSSL